MRLRRRGRCVARLEEALKMVVLSISGSTLGRGVVGLGILLGLAGCSSSSHGTNNNQPSDSGQSSGGDGGMGAAALGNCVSADTTACSSFTTPTGAMIQLGPYGAQMDVNVGKGFENTVPSSDTGTQPSTQCQTFANLFAEDPKLTTQLLTTSMNGVTIDFSLYSVYRPAVWPSGPVPVITWGNGTCAQPEGYGALLRYVASYGYFVVAANMRQVGTANTTGTGSPQPMLRALDYAQAANMDSSSPYYQKLDMSNVGAMVHSQGGAATAAAASDSRVQDVIIFNGLAAGNSAKPFWTISGDMDVTGATTQSMKTLVNGASSAAAWSYYHMPAGMGGLRGHLVLMLSPERVEKPTVAWWEMIFRNDAASKNYFVGSTCLLCTMDPTTGVGSADYGANSMLQ
jgi:hypothetical protein